MTNITIVSADYSPGWYEEGYDDDPYSSGTIAGTGKIVTRVEGDLAARVLARLGKTQGEVTILEDHWDLGYCVTCSSEVVDFEVAVDGEKVYRTQYYGSEEYTGNTEQVEQFVNTYQAFNDWLNGGEINEYPYS